MFWKSYCAYIAKVLSIHYTFGYAIQTHLDTLYIFFPSEKINGTKMLIFLSRTPTQYSFTFNLRFWYVLKRKVRLSKTACRFFHFRFRLLFIKVYIFSSTTCMDCVTLKRHKFFQNKNNRKATYSFLSRPLIFKLQQEILEFCHISLC